MPPSPRLADGQHAERARDHRRLVGEDVAEQVLGQHARRSGAARARAASRTSRRAGGRARRRGSPSRPRSPPAPRAATPRARWPCARGSRGGGAGAPPRRPRARCARSRPRRRPACCAPRAGRRPARGRAARRSRARRSARARPAGRCPPPPRGRSVEASASAGNTCAGRRFANSPSSLRMREQPLLGAHVDRQRVPLRPAHRAEQHGAALARALEHRRRRAACRWRRSTAPPISPSSSASVGCRGAPPPPRARARPRRVTSGPMPSPGSRSTLLGHAQIPRGSSAPRWRLCHSSLLSACT